MGCGRGFGHPDRQERQGPVGLANDEVIDAGVAFGADNGDHLAAAGVERIRDPNLKRRTPGSMTLVRPIPVERTSTSKAERSGPAQARPVIGS